MDCSFVNITINSNFKAKIPDLDEKFPGKLMDLAEDTVIWLADYFKLKP